MERTHGLTGIPEYDVWKQMRQRCLNTTSPAFRRYGARGISVCARWDSFAAFIEDMGRRPTALHTIERIDNDGDYEPGNCRWATMAEQCVNRRSSVFLTYAGQTRTISQWTRTLGFPRHMISDRINRGWTVERALSEPANVQMVNKRFRRHGVSP